jgi:hypothetical protein
MQLAPAFKGRIERSRQVTPVTAAHIPEQPASMYEAPAPFLGSIIINN